MSPQETRIEYTGNIHSPAYRDPRRLRQRIEHHRWCIEFGGLYAEHGVHAEDHARVILWLEKRIAAATPVQTNAHVSTWLRLKKLIHNGGRSRA